MEKGPEHPFALELLSAFRAPGHVMPPFNRPTPREYAWDCPDNPDHSSEVKADIAEMARLWRIREVTFLGQPCPEDTLPVPNARWRRLFRLRNRYHSLAHALQCEGLSEEIQADVLAIARCRRNRSASLNGLERPETDQPIPKAVWQKCFYIRARYSSLEEALEHQGLSEYR